jgi:uncharacterized protein (TIGR03643 family)
LDEWRLNWFLPGVIRFSITSYDLIMKIPPISSSEIIAMAWADEVSFDKIKRETGLAEGDVIRLMRCQLKPRSFALWRARVSGRKAKHERKNRLPAMSDVDDL